MRRFAGRTEGLLLSMILAMARTAPSTAQTRPTPLRPSLHELEIQIVRDSNDPVVYYELGRSYLEHQRLDEAERCWRAALTLAPEYGQAYLALATLPEVRGEAYWKRVRRERGDAVVDAAMDESARFYRRAFLIDPLVDLSILPREEERVSITIDGYNYPVWWVFPMTKAINILRQGKFQEALDRFDKIIMDVRSGPRQAWAPSPVYWYHGMAAARLGRFDLAVQDYWTLVQRESPEERTLSLKIVPLSINHFRYLLATMLYLDGRFDQAIPVFERTLEFDIGLYQSHVQLARMHEARQEWEAAILERQHAIESNPDDATLLVDLGATLVLAGRPLEAEEALSQAAHAGPRDPRPWYLLGQVAEHNGHREVSRDAYTRFLAVAPSRFAAQRTEVEARLR